MVRDSMSALPPGEMFSLIKFLFKDDIFASLKSPKSLAASDLARASPSAPFLWRMLVSSRVVIMWSNVLWQR